MSDYVNFSRRIIQLTDCFSAGYTMPQYCIDNKIKNPVFILKSLEQIQTAWEIHQQFSRYRDLNIQPKFSVLNGEEQTFNFGVVAIFPNMNLKKFDNINLEEHDCIIALFDDEQEFNFERVIFLNKLVEDFQIKVFAEIPIENFWKNHPDVKVIAANFPLLKDYGENTKYEKKILSHENEDLIFDVRNELLQNPEKELPDEYKFLNYSREKFLTLISAPQAKKNLDGTTSMYDDEFLNIRNGKRATAYQPTEYKNKIYFIGNCIYYGFGTPYDKTVESYLQKILNENNLPYRVENESQPFSGRYEDLFFNLNKLPVKPGDIIFVGLQGFITNDISIIDVSNVFNRPHTKLGEVFFDVSHINENGYKFLAEVFFDFLYQNNFFREINFEFPAPPPIPPRYGIPKEEVKIYPELEEYKNLLCEKRLPIGAIVMNCNPFTFGHEYLIEYAAKRVGKLFIFVVEEDKSEFKFADRFKLVQEGVKKFSNVEVLPSGKFIISQQTFSGYFNKSELQDVQVDSSEDVEIFAKEIAPTLGITVRFVGEEPEDNVTRQYNETMRNILPLYGIELCEIPRKKIGEDFISAKKVREALKVGDFEKIKKLVPKTTLRFLKENFKNHD